jgi:peptidoglycan/LPS O-acetylase OafA/YrhL
VGLELLRCFLRWRDDDEEPNRWRCKGYRVSPQSRSNRMISRVRRPVRLDFARFRFSVEQGVPKPEGGKLPYLPWMDGMRAIAVIVVMLFHELVSQIGFRPAWNFAGGQYGVDIFFAISGFLITSLLLIEQRRRGTISFAGFYMRRVRRILPALWTLLAVVIVVALFANDTGDMLARVGIAGGFATDWVMALTHFNMDELGQTWSLAVEEQFYLLWPLLLTCLVVLTRRRRRMLPVAVAALTAVLLLEVVRAAHDGWSGQRIYYGLDTRAAALGLGAVLGSLYATGMLPSARRVRLILGPVALVAVVVVAPAFRNQQWLAKVVRHLGLGYHAGYAEALTYAAVALTATLVIWYLLIAPNAIAGRVLAWGPIRWIGRISYGLYLWDGTLTSWLTPRFVGVSGWGLVAIHFAVVFAAATASYYLIERRFMRRRAGTATKPTEPVTTSRVTPSPAASTVPS